MKDWPHFVVKMDEDTGLGRGVEMDGQNLEGVRSVVVKTNVNDVTTVTIEFITTSPVETRTVSPESRDE